MSRDILEHLIQSDVRRHVAPMAPSETVGDRVHRAMKLRGIGFNQLDRLIGLKAGYTSGLVNPRRGQKPRDPKGGTLLALAIGLDTTEAWLLTGEPGSEPPRREPAASSKADLIYEDVRVNDALAEAVRWAKMHNMDPRAIAKVEMDCRATGYSGLTPQDIVDDIVREGRRLDRAPRLPEPPVPDMDDELAKKRAAKKKTK